MGDFLKTDVVKTLVLTVAGLSESKEQEGKGEESMIIYRDNTSVNSELEKVSAASFGEVKVSGFIPDSDCQGQLYRVMKDGAKVVIVGISSEDAAVLPNDMKMMGFGEVTVTEDGNLASRLLVATKPDWGNSNKASLKVGGSTEKKWSMGGGDLAEMDLVDEDDLLNDGITVDAAACAPPADGGKKRACKNCSCGLAEVEAAELKGEQTKIDPLVKASGCGSCSKGDAFRCASCPFLGKPAFEPGQEKVVLSMSDDI